MTGSEAFILHSLTQSQESLGAAMAELGVYEGSSAQIICEAKGDSPLYLFDTFAGLPKPGPDETRWLKQGQYSASFAAVEDRLCAYRSVRLRPGLFPESTVGMGDVQFSMVHLDADLYSSTLAGLEYFYPRMVSTGIILLHDYSTLPGVAQAVTEYLSSKREAVIELPTTQAMIVVR